MRFLESYENMNEMPETIFQIEFLLKDFFNGMQGLSGIYLFDRNANLITCIKKESNLKQDQSLIISSGVLYLSAMKLLQNQKDSLDFCIVQFMDSEFLLIEIDERLLLITAEKEARMDHVFVNCRALTNRILEIDPNYEMPERRISLEEKLEEITDEYRERFKFFLSYAKSDSEIFKIPQIAQYFEEQFNAEVMYFEKSKRTGEDILDYMERGVKWCNVFLWFHSPNSMNSEAVKKEYKMAAYLGKKIVSITNDFNSLPLSARVTWSILFNQDHGQMCADIMNDLKQFDIHKAKYDW